MECMEIFLSSRVVPVYRSTRRGGIGWEGGREEGGRGGRAGFHLLGGGGQGGSFPPKEEIDYIITS